MKLALLLRIIELFNKRIAAIQKRKILKLQQISSTEKEISTLLANRDNERQSLINLDYFLPMQYTYFETIKLQLANCNQKLAKLINEQKALEEKIIELYTEQKKYQILYEHGKTKEKLIANSQEIKMLDEFATRSFQKV